MRWLDRLIGKRTTEEPHSSQEQAIIIALNGTSLPDHVYQECDTSTLEDMFDEALADVGQCDGTETGPENTKIFVYGRDAEAMFSIIEPILRGYPLGATALVTIRAGPVGAPEREVRIPA